MRAFNELVFDGTVRGVLDVYSSSDFNDRLGRADELTYEVEVEEASGTAPTITVRHLHSNSGRAFIGLSAFVSGGSLASLPFRDVKTVTGPLGGLGQVGVTLGGTSPVARVRIWACGRTR